VNCDRTPGSQVRLGLLDPSLQFGADIAPDQQGNEGANLGIDEFRCHPVKALVHRFRVQQLVELLVDPVGHVLQVTVELGWALAGVRHCGTCHASNVDPC